MKIEEFETTDTIQMQSEIFDWIGGLRTHDSVSGINNLFVKGIKKKRKRKYCKQIKIVRIQNEIKMRNSKNRQTIHLNLIDGI